MRIVICCYLKLGIPKSFLPKRFFYYIVVFIVDLWMFFLRGFSFVSHLMFMLLNYDTPYGRDIP